LSGATQGAWPGLMSKPALSLTAYLAFAPPGSGLQLLAE
jgi:hypothetical protein